MSTEADEPTGSCVFGLGRRVRVRSGARHRCDPELSMRGWVGTVIGADSSGLYLVQWTEETIDKIHHALESRKEGQEECRQEHWLADEDLEFCAADAIPDFPPLEAPRHRAFATGPTQHPVTLLGGRLVYAGDPCPCGSRRAYKDCCLRRAERCEDAGSPPDAMGFA